MLIVELHTGAASRKTFSQNRDKKISITRHAKIITLEKISLFGAHSYIIDGH